MLSIKLQATGPHHSSYEPDHCKLRKPIHSGEKLVHTQDSFVLHFVSPHGRR